MADEIQELLERNKAWAEKIEQEDPGFFARLTKQQKPRFLWIGCSDSRVPANQITGLMPGSASDVVLLDCRNDYESEHGTFVGAVPLNTKTFAETWSKLDDVLKDKPKETKILTYTTPRSAASPLVLNILSNTPSTSSNMRVSISHAGFVPGEYAV